MKKFHAIMILSRLLAIIPRTISTLIFLVVFLISSNFSALSQGILIYYVFSRFFILFYDWLTTRYEITQSHIAVSHGIIYPSLKTAAWKDVRDETVTSDPILRLKNFEHITLSLYGDTTNSIELFAVSHEEAQRIKTGIKIAHLNSDTTDADKLVNTAGTVHRAITLTKKLSAKDYLLIGFTYAQFIAIIPPAYALLRFIFFDHQYSDDAMANLMSFISLSAPVRAGIIIVLFVIGIIYGWVLAWLRFSQVSVNKIDDGYEYNAGFFHHTSQFIPFENIESLLISQNLLMQLIHRYQLSVITGSAGLSQSSYTLIPLAPRAEIEKFTHDFLHEAHCADISSANTEYASHTTHISTALLIIFALCFCTAWLKPHRIVATAVAILVLVLFVLLNALSIVYTIAEGNETLHITLGFFNHKQYVLRAQEIHSISIHSASFAHHSIDFVTLRILGNGAHRITLCAPTRHMQENIMQLVKQYAVTGGSATYGN